MSKRYTMNKLKLVIAKQIIMHIKRSEEGEEILQRTGSSSAREGEHGSPVAARIQPKGRLYLRWPPSHTSLLLEEPRVRVCVACSWQCSSAHRSLHEPATKSSGSRDVRASMRAKVVTATYEPDGVQSPVRARDGGTTAERRQEGLRVGVCTRQAVLGQGQGQDKLSGLRVQSCFTVTTGETESWAGVKLISQTCSSLIHRVDQRTFEKIRWHSF
jgi:hypothetical protein